MSVSHIIRIIVVECDNAKQVGDVFIFTISMFTSMLCFLCTWYCIGATNCTIVQRRQNADHLKGVETTLHY